MASADKEKDALTKSRETAEERLQAQAETKSLGYAGARKRASVSSTVAAAPPSGEVANASKLADTDSLRRDAKGFPSDSMVPGAVGRAGAAAPAAMPAQPVVTSAPANDQAKSDQARVDAAAAAPALPAVAALRLVDSTTVSHDGVAVQRKVYEVRPGVRVTLDIAAQVADRQAPVDARVRAKQVPAPAVAGMVGTLNTIIWSDSLGTQYTLSGLVSVEELEKIKAQMR